MGFHFLYAFCVQKRLTKITFPIRMILFYSDFCPHCRMLLDTIERHDTQKTIKIVSIEAMRAQGKQVPRQITAVPALVLVPSKNVLIGKHVFDYLLLPGKGKLLLNVGAEPSDITDIGGTGASPSVPSEPMAYSISMCGLSDAFAPIDHNVNVAESTLEGLSDRSYNWASIEIEKDQASVFANTPFQEETRNKKMLPDLDAIKSQRDMELTQNDLNTSQLLPPTCTR